MSHYMVLVCNSCRAKLETPAGRLSEARNHALGHGWGRTHAGGDACPRCRRPAPSERDSRRDAIALRLYKEGKTAKQAAEVLGMTSKQAFDYMVSVAERSLSSLEAP